MNPKRDLKTHPNNDNASAPMSAVESLMRELENISPRELEMLSAAHGLAPGASVPGLGSRGYRLDQLGARGRVGREAHPAAGPGVDWALVHAPARDDVASRLPTTRARVYGDSMRDAGLRDGDAVELDLDSEPRDGDIVLAHVEGFGRVLRTLRIVGGVQILRAANAGFQAIAIHDPAMATFHGVVVHREDR